MIVNDEKIKMLWRCSECKEEANVNPSFYQDNGTPMCEEGEDMDYIETNILEKIR